MENPSKRAVENVLIFESFLFEILLEKKAYRNAYQKKKTDSAMNSYFDLTYHNILLELCLCICAVVVVDDAVTIHLNVCLGFCNFFFFLLAMMERDNYFTSVRAVIGQNDNKGKENRYPFNVYLYIMLVLGPLSFRTF